METAVELDTDKKRPPSPQQQQQRCWHTIFLSTLEGQLPRSAKQHIETFSRTHNFSPWSRIYS